MYLLLQIIPIYLLLPMSAHDLIIGMELFPSPEVWDLLPREEISLRSLHEKKKAEPTMLQIR
jgi:hypothetical protein